MHNVGVGLLHPCLCLHRRALLHWRAFLRGRGRRLWLCCRTQRVDGLELGPDLGRNGLNNRDSLRTGATVIDTALPNLFDGYLLNWHLFYMLGLWGRAAKQTLGGSKDVVLIGGGIPKGRFGTGAGLVGWAAEERRTRSKRIDACLLSSRRHVLHGKSIAMVKDGLDGRGVVWNWSS